MYMYISHVCVCICIYIYIYIIYRIKQVHPGVPRLSECG